MDYQVLFNLATAGLGFLFGFLLNNVWGDIKSLQQNERETTTRIGAIEVLVAGNYVTKAEFSPVRSLVFGAVALILVGFMGALPYLTGLKP